MLTSVVCGLSNYRNFEPVFYTWVHTKTVDLLYHVSLAVCSPCVTQPWYLLVQQVKSSQAKKKWYTHCRSRGKKTTRVEFKNYSAFPSLGGYITRVLPLSSLLSFGVVVGDENIFIIFTSLKEGQSVYPQTTSSCSNSVKHVLVVDTDRIVHNI